MIHSILETLSLALAIVILSVPLLGILTLARIIIGVTSIDNVLAIMKEKQ